MKNRKEDLTGICSTTRLLAAATCAIALAVAAMGGGRLPADATWIGPWDGLWSVAANWSGGVVPNGGTWNVYIDGNGGTASCAHVDGTYTVGTLTIDADDVLRIDHARTLYIDAGPALNNGALYLDSTGVWTYLRFSSPDIALTGSGAVIMGNSAYNVLRASSQSDGIINGPDHTIRGAGELGYNYLLLENQGLVQADQPTFLKLNLSGAETNNPNTGIMQATDGATLDIWQSSIDNAGGVIQALDNSFVDLTHESKIYNGTLSTQGTGLVRVPAGQYGYLIDVTNEGHISVASGGHGLLEGTITNNNTISLDSAGIWTYLWCKNPQTTLTGAGELVLGDLEYNVVRGNDYTDRLIHAAGHTIRGGGNLGGDEMMLTNQGLIQADQPGVTMEIELDGSTANNFNTGTMQATGGGTLWFHGLNVDNTGGVIQALDGSAVELTAESHIIGGTLTTQGSGVVRVPAGHFGYLVDLSNEGHVSVNTGGQCHLEGTITNNNTISLDSTASGTYLMCKEDETTLTGTGEVILGDLPFNYIRGNEGTDRLIHDAGHTIRGGGNIGYNNQLVLTNHGLIQADQPGVTMEIDLYGSDDTYNFNLAVMQATGGGILWIKGSHINNESGIIEALDASLVQLTGSSHIYHGTVNTEGSGVVEVAPGQFAYFTDVASEGHLAVANGGRAYLHGTLTNNAVMTLDSTGTSTYLCLDDPVVTLTGDGEFILGDSPFNKFHTDDPGSVLINGPDHTIRGGGELCNNLTGLLSHGSIIADAPGGMTIDPHADAAFENAGVLHVTGDGSLDVDPGPMDQHGTVLIDAACTLHRDGDYTQTGGTTTVQGTLEVASGVADIQGGVLEGTGLVAGDLVPSGGTASPGLSFGTLTAEDFSPQRCGTLLIEIGGYTPDTEHDVLIVNDTADCGGTLQVQLVPPFVPGIGDSFDVITAGAASGRFDCLDFPALPSGYFFVQYGPDVVSVIVRAQPPVYADVNHDDLVDVLDLLILLADWGACACDCCPADMNADGEVNVLDLLELLANWT